MKSVTILLAILSITQILNVEGLVTGQLGAPIPFSFSETQIDVVGSNNDTLLTLTFGVSQGCKKSNCYLTVTPYNSISRSSTTNLAPNSTILTLGDGFSNAQAINITISPTSALLNSTILTFPQFSESASSYSGFIYDVLYRQFGRLRTQNGNSIYVQSSYMVPSVYLFATVTSSDAYPLVNSQYYDLTGGVSALLSLGNYINLNLTSTYSNSIQILFYSKNPSSAQEPIATRLSSYYNITLRNPSGYLSGQWRFTSNTTNVDQLNRTVLAYASTKATSYSIPAYNVSRFLVLSNNSDPLVVQNFDSIVGTWGLYTTTGHAELLRIFPSLLVLAIFCTFV